MKQCINVSNFHLQLHVTSFFLMQLTISITSTTMKAKYNTTIKIIICRNAPPPPPPPPPPSPPFTQLTNHEPQQRTTVETSFYFFTLLLLVSVPVSVGTSLHTLPTFPRLRFFLSPPCQHVPQKPQGDISTLKLFPHSRRPKGLQEAPCGSVLVVCKATFRVFSSGLQVGVAGS